MSPEEMYDGIVDNIHDLDAATENARLLYNHLVEGGAKPDRPALPHGFLKHTRRESACLSGLAWLCIGINSLTGTLR